LASIKNYDCIVVTPWVSLGIFGHLNEISAIDFLADNAQTVNEDLALSRLVQQYIEQKKLPKTLKLKPQGTPFQRKIWSIMQTIPFGQTLTYKQLAITAGSGPRAVANACRANPIPLLIPCHRVVASNGLGGFAGQTQGRLVRLKQQLLQWEGAI